MPKKTELQNKMSLLQKLFDTGCVTEKQLQGLKMEDILVIPGITVEDMRELVILQKCSKKNRLFSYLSEKMYSKTLIEYSLPFGK